MFRLYCDEDSMDQDWVRALRARGMDVTTALEENMVSRKDEEHLDYATEQGRVLFSYNRGDSGGTVVFEGCRRELREGLGDSIALRLGLPIPVLEGMGLNLITQTVEG